MILQTNHLGPFLLTKSLLPLIKKAEQGRIIQVASEAHKMTKNVGLDDFQSEKKYEQWWVYGKSKLANILFTQELQKQLDPTHIKAVCLHPGVIKTEFFGTFVENSPFKKMCLSLFASLVFKSQWEGA